MKKGAARETWFKARVRKEADGRLAITWRYREPKMGRGTHWIDTTGEWFGVPFLQWERSIGRTVDLTQWKGAAYGMIGGPAKMNRDGVMYCGWLSVIAGFPPQILEHYVSEEMLQRINKEARDLEEELSDERFEYSPERRQELESRLAAGRAFLATQRCRSDLKTGG